MNNIYIRMMRISFQNIMRYRNMRGKLIVFEWAIEKSIKVKIQRGFNKLKKYNDYLSNI